MKGLKWGLFSLLNVVCLLLFANMTYAQMKIYGEVSDSNNKSIEGVLVRLYRGNAKIGERRTGTDGTYTIPFSVENGSRITMIRYDHSNWHPTIVRNVSGRRKSEINKIILSRGEPLSAADRQELVTTLNAIYALDSANGVSAAEFSSKYSDSVSKAQLSTDMEGELAFKKDLNNGLPFKPSKSEDWFGAIAVGGQLVPIEMQLEFKGTLIVGSVSTSQGRIPIKEGKKIDNSVELLLDTPQGAISFKGILKDKTISGKVTASTSSEVIWTVTKKPQ